MKKQLVAIALGACFGMFPAWSQPSYPASLLVAQDASTAQAVELFMKQLDRGDYRAVLQNARDNPAQARQIIGMLRNIKDNFKTPQEKGVYRLAVTLLARGIELSGDPSALKQVKTEKALDAKVAKYTLESAPSVPETVVSASAQEVVIPFQLTLYLIEAGNIRQLPVMFSALQADLEEFAGKETSNLNLKLGFEIAALQARMMGGEYQLARSEGDRLISLGHKYQDPVELAACYAVLLHAAKLGAMPDVTAKHLPNFRKAVQALKGEDELPLYQLALRTHELEWALTRNPNLPYEELLKRYSEAWANIPKYAIPDTADGSSIHFNDAAKFWMRETMDVARLTRGKQPKLNQQALTAFQSILAQTSRLAEQETKANRFSIYLGLALALLDLHGDLISWGENKVARDSYSAITDADLANLDKMMADAQQEAWAQAPEHFKKRLPPGFQYDLRAGTLSLIRERFFQAKLRQLMADNPNGLSPQQQAEARQWAEQGLIHNQRALTGGGYQGLADIRWTILEFLFREKPSGWQSEASTLLGQMQQLSQEVAHRPGVARTLMLRGELQADQGQLQEAIRSLQTAIDNVESYVSDVGGGQRGSEAIRKGFKRGYDLLAKLLLQAGDAQQALTTITRQRQLETAELNQQALAGQTESVAKLQQIRGQTEVLQQQYAANKSMGQPTAAVEKLLAQNKTEFHQVLSDLRRTNPEYEQRLAIRPVNFSKLQSSIPDNTTVVQYFPTKDALFIFVVTSKDLKIRQVAITDARLEELVRDTRQLIAEVPLDPELNRHPESFTWKDDGSKLYKRHTARLKSNLVSLHNYLINPIESDLVGRPVLAVIPTGHLHYVPYPALLREEGGGVKHLTERFQCVNIVTVADLARISHPPAEKRPTVFAMGNPDGSLPGAEREVKKITQFFPKAQSVVGSKATADQLKKIPPQTSYVHLATHGHLDGKSPTHSYLVVAGEGPKGRFEVGEIYGLPLEGVRLVTLSACQTAVEDHQPGSEVTNLAEAFSVAGGNSVLASLWSVSDEGTEALMSEFYKGLAQGQPLSEALQKAEVAVLKQPQLAHPFYWASFTLFGDWR
jgi:CHAT domain-containing protein